jgi:hypothetical protein
MLFIYTLLIIAAFFYVEFLNSRYKYLQAIIGRMIVCISMIIWGYWVMWWLVVAYFLDFFVGSPGNTGPAFTAGGFRDGFFTKIADGHKVLD